MYTIASLVAPQPTTMYQQTLLCLLFASIFVLQVVSLCRKRATRRLLLPPGPRRLPIIGNLHQVGAMTHRSLNELSRKHGPLMYLKLGTVPTLVVSSSDIVREVCKSHDLAFSSRPHTYATNNLFYGSSDVAFSPYGEYWRQVRMICVLEMLSLKRVRSFRSVREEETASLVALIKRSSMSSSSTINLSRLAMLLSNNVVRRVMFGDKYSGSSYECEYDEKNKIHDVLEEIQMLLGTFWFSDFFPLLGWIDSFTGLKRRLKKNFEELDAIYSQEIEEHSKAMSTFKTPVDDDGDLVHSLLRLQKDQTHGNILSNMDHIKGLLTDMFIAGTETSASSIVWTMTELVRNPKVMSKVQEELQMVVGDKAMVEESELERLHYLKLVVKEVLRLHPPAPLLVPRETIEPSRIGGFDVPSGTRVFVNATAIATDPMNWESPTEFRPERFLDSARDFRGQDFELIPFGFGRRGCPGLNFAVVAVELTLANLLHCFDWGLPAGVKDLDMEEKLGLTVHKKNALCLVAKSTHN